MRKIVAVIAALGAIGIAAWWIVEKNGEAESLPLRPETDLPASCVADVPKAGQQTPSGNGRDSVSSRPDEPSEGEDETESEPLTEEEKREAAEEKLVEAFDSLTDAWMEPGKNGVTMSDVAKFAEAFRKIPEARQDECIHRALNLVPDENVMLLAGVLMDKSMDKEIVETVYNDILNRDEDVKKPILQQIFKDKAHPCWADTAWILDVTGELPKK